MISEFSGCECESHKNQEGATTTRSHEIIGSIVQLLAMLRCATCHKKAEVLVLHMPDALCQECYEWIYVEKGDWVSPSGQEFARTFYARDYYLQQQKHKESV